jgi:hypothetical protein
MDGFEDWMLNELTDILRSEYVRRLKNDDLDKAAFKITKKEGILAAEQWRKRIESDHSTPIGKISLIRKKIEELKTKKNEN